MESNEDGLRVTCPDVRLSAASLLVHTADHALYRLMLSIAVVFVSKKLQGYLFANGTLA
jgi:hypothetical protein